MRFYRFFSVLILVSVCITLPAKKLKAENNPKVILKVGRNSQHDSLGYNVVQQFLLAAYSHIVSGELKLWTGPDKRGVYNADSLKALEKRNNISFYDINYIFLYEVWEQDKKQLRFTTQGYQLAYKNQQTQAVVGFGYIDHAEALKYLNEYKLPCNAFGWSSISLYQVIDRRMFDYQLYVFNGKNVTSDEEAFKLERTHLANKSIAYRSDSVELSKLVTYRIERDTNKVIDPKSRISNYFLNVLEDKLNEDRAFRKYYVSGSLDRPYKMLIAELKFRETYTYTNGKWQEKLRGMSFIDTENNHYLIPLEELDKLNIKIENKSLEAFLKEKEYFHVFVDKINEQFIPLSKSHDFEEALSSGKLFNLHLYIK